MRPHFAFVCLICILSPSLPAAPGDWSTYGNGLKNHRFSPHSEINTSNVHQLKLAWKFNTGIKATFQTSPLKIDNTLYLSIPFNHVIALAADTGRLRWRYTHPLESIKSCCGPSNRGLAAKNDRLFMATLDGHLIALNRHDGSLLWDKKVEDLSLNIQESLSGLFDKEALGNNTRILGGTSHSFNMAPQVFNNQVIVGSTGAGYGLHLDTETGLKVVGLGDGRTGLRGFVAAFDVTTGAELWRWYSVSGENWVGKWRELTPDGEYLNRNIGKEKSRAERFRNSWKLGGGSIWTTPAVDTETGWLFIGTGNPAPNMDSSTRPGDNLHTSSLVALDSTTGEIKWAYQQVPHDRWGYDVSSPPVLFETTYQGKKIKAIGQAGKTGWFYVHHRKTGQLLFRSEAFVPQQNMFTDPTEQGVTIAPGIAGGTSWSPVSVNSHKNRVYVPAIHRPATYYRKALKSTSGLPWQTYSYFEFENDHEQYGTLSSINLETGKIRWQHKTRLPLIGGVLATSGGLVFSGEGDGEFFALDEDSGKKLWSFQQVYGVNAPAISYTVNGKQFIAVAAGGNKLAGYTPGDSLLVFNLPE